MKPRTTLKPQGICTVAWNALLLLSLMTLAVGCEQQGQGLAALALDSSEACQPGQARECGLPLGEQDEVLTCLRGEQRCVDGSWSECEGTAISSVKVGSSSTTAHWASLNAPSACQNSPCDPSCRNFLEAPDQGITNVTKAGGGVSWKTGSPSKLKGGQAKKSFTEPCSTASDCQLNTYCRFPDSGSCTHSKCAVGDALDPGCDPCVAEICNQAPECCQAVLPSNTTKTKTLIPLGDTWRYNATGLYPGGYWTAQGYWDWLWPEGKAHFGFGENDEVTKLPSSYSSYYFRRAFTVAANDLLSAKLRVTFDDGFVVYVNGTQVMSRNVGSVEHWADASAKSKANEVAEAAIPINVFQDGENVIAVLVKNAKNSKNLSFDLRLDVEVPEEPVAQTAPWSAACVERVASVCGAVCDDDPTLPAETGQCTPWYPSETSDTCSGVDLAVGIPCDGTVPVCNHGNATAPAGVRLVHFPGNSQHMPTCSPDMSKNSMEECFTDQPIPPGACINVSSCTGLQPSREIMVNPPGAAHIDECQCRDNWAVYADSECTTPQCAGGTNTSVNTLKPVDIIILVDNSGSMSEEITAVQDRINEDLAGVLSSSGLDYRVIMMSRFGDVNKAVGSSDHPICVKAPLGGNSCTNPKSEKLKNNAPHFYHYSVDVGSNDAWCRILEAWSHPDELASDYRAWTATAPGGLQELLRPEAFKQFLVLTDDGVDCSYGGYSFDDKDKASNGTSAAAAFDTALLALSPAQFGTKENRNYAWHSIVGMKSNSPKKNPWPASAPIQTQQCSPGSEAPGTGYQALSILTGGLRHASCNNNDFDAIFQTLATQIGEQAALSCTFAVGSVEQMDPDKTQVSIVTEDGEILFALKHVAGPESCTTDGYYYQDAATVVLCPSACSTAQSQPNARVALEAGCKGVTAYQQEPYTQRYEAECPTGSRPQWGFFSYDSDTPADSRIDFRVRLAATEDELATAPSTLLATAAAATGTQSCLMSGPSPCPIDLYESVGGKPAASFTYLDLEVTLYPSSDATQAPVLNDWRITYSCLASE